MDRNEYPGKRDWLAELRRLVQYRDLLWMLALGELRAKHRQTALGMLWAVFQPLAMMIVFAVVFSSVLGVSMGRVPYVPFAFVGVLCWHLLASSVSAGMSSVVSNMNLVSKANFPREVLPLARLVPPLVDFGVGVAVLVAILVWYGMRVSHAMVLLPWVMLVNLMFVVGLMLITSAIYVLKRDLGSLLPLGLQIWMVLSPVFYPIEMVPESYRWLYMANPMASIITTYRSICLVGEWPPVAWLSTASMMSVAVLVMGYGFFKSVESRFADVM